MRNYTLYFGNPTEFHRKRSPAVQLRRPRFTIPSGTALIETSDTADTHEAPRVRRSSERWYGFTNRFPPGVNKNIPNHADKTSVLINSIPTNKNESQR